MVAAADHRLIITPDSGLAEFCRAAGLDVRETQRPQSDVIAQLAWRKLERKETVAPEILDANYIRRSDAEIFSKQ
jgi:hypothetical protein